MIEPFGWPLVRQIGKFFLLSTMAIVLTYLAFKSPFLGKFGFQLRETVVMLLDLFILLRVFKLHTRENFQKLSSAPFSFKWALFAIVISLLTKIGIGVLGFIVFGTQIANNSIDSQMKNVLGMEHLKTPLDLFLAILTTAVLTPIYEELFNRGIIYNSAKMRWGVAAGLILSSLFFSILHILPFLIFVSFFLGIIFAISYEKSKNIFVPIIAHGVVNLGPFIILFFTNGN